MRPSDIHPFWRHLDSYKILDYGLNDEQDFPDTRLWFFIGSENEWKKYGFYQEYKWVAIPCGCIFPVMGREYGLAKGESKEA
jgi:hypothetical protein